MKHLQKNKPEKWDNNGNPDRPFKGFDTKIFLLGKQTQEKVIKKVNPK